MAQLVKTAGLRAKGEPFARPAGTVRNWTAGRSGPPTVAVVICAHTEDRWNEMVFAATSVLQQTHRATEILLVIDHNPALLRRANFELRGVVSIPNENEKGLSSARQTGVRAATSDIVAFLDDDAFAAPNWLATLVAPYADPDVLSVGGRVIPAWRAGRPGWFPPEFDWVVGCSYRGMPVARAPLRNYIGTNMSLRRERFLDSGGFDETDPYRRQLRGSHLYEPAAVVRLGVPRSQSTWSYFRSRCFSAGMSKALGGGPVGPAGSYLRTVIPKGLGRSVAAALHRDPTAAREVLGLSAGVAITGVGYLFGRSQAARDRFAKRRSAAPPSVRAAPVPRTASSLAYHPPTPSAGRDTATASRRSRRSWPER